MRKFILLLVFGVLVSIIGCTDNKESSGEKKEEVVKENREAEQNQKETEKEEGKKEDPSQHDANKTNELGMTPGLPKDFPADVPQPKNSKTLGSLNSSEGTVVTFESTDNVPETVTFYKEEMKKNGYNISEAGENIPSDNGGLINWIKDKKEVSMMLAFDKEKKLTSLVITYK